MFRIPPVTKNIIIINVLFFLAKFICGRTGVDLDMMCGLHFFMAQGFHFYQFLTYLFMHGSLEHLFFNMLAVWMFGGAMEQAWGAKRYLVFYLVCGLGAGLIQEVVQYVEYVQLASQFASIPPVALNGWLTVGASGAVYGILLAFGMTFPDSEMIIFPIPIPIKAKYFVIFYIVIELFSGFAGSGDGVAHFAHLGGMLFGFLLILYWKKHPYGAFYEGSGPGFGWFREAVKRKPKMTVHYGDREREFEYNLRKKEQSEEINHILEKLRRSGYESLTVDEKKKLFDASQK